MTFEELEVLTQEALKYHPWGAVLYPYLSKSLVLVIHEKDWRWARLMVWFGLRRHPYVPETIGGVPTRIEIWPWPRQF